MPPVLQTPEEISRKIESTILRRLASVGESMTKYKIKISVWWLSPNIDAIYFVRETNLALFNALGGKVLKRTSNVEYHDTWESAHLALTKNAERKVLAARRSLEVANSFAGDVRGMKKP